MNKLLVFTWLGFLSVSFALAQSFTYQGYLREGGVPANGAFNLTFKLFNAASGGVQVGSTITLDETGVANGLFTVELNFGATAFTGADRWLEMAVNGTTLTPRVKITAAPLASFSQNTRGITVDGSNNVGLGTATPSARLDVVGTARVSAFRMTTGAAAGRVLTSDATGMGTWQNAPGLTLPFSGTGIAFPGEAVFKITNSSSGYALLGQSDGNGIGVAGLSTTTVGVNKGVYGMSASASGTGVYGEVPSTTGSTYGGYFTSASQTGFGVYGVSTATTGVAHGGSFWSQSTNGIGVNGYVSAPTGITVGGLFQSDSVNGYGLISNAMATSGTTYAGYFYNTSSGGTAVYGRATATTGNTFGGFFESDSSTGTGVLARTGQAGAIALHAINTAGGTAARFSGNISVTSNVGIGTTTPTSSLHIAAPIPILTIQDSDGSSDQAGYISFQDNSGTERGYIGYGSTTTPHAYFFNNRTGGNIILGTAGIERLIVASNGNVGIGTSAPSFRLDVRTTGIIAVSGRTTSAAGTGVFGQVDAPTGTTVGVWGESNSNSGRGVIGLATSGSGNTFGVRGESGSTAGMGVFGLAYALSGSTRGGFFRSDSSAGVGVHGFVSSITGSTIGVQGISSSPSGRGVYGEASSGSGATFGVYGFARSTGGAGVYGQVLPTTGFGVGVWGVCTAAQGWGVYSDGRLGASGTKSFRIDHPLDPENKYLLHYCTEGPEPQNVYNGTVITDQSGEAWVELPDYFAEINRDFRYQLTVLDESEEFVLAKVAKKIVGNRFQIRTSRPHVEVCWEVKAVRNDLFVRRHGAPVETDKPEHERGKYQHPELYDQPKEKGRNYYPEPTHENDKPQ